ncbi:hypothetical protein T440DRAFT_500908 [Plenodomus tracheiphilus IPT5]|uniref:Rad21/Rec8-like protein N-terminal domain-containing protein n=1 Tax=Plenodomus tracheiphilus IPT5 TaxID=1408161 RepID=A0A6A7AX69_9PLEO|nr:hypothetical protein T440DRAFT_500908 [Plenodomus tracheiphilus IPT5]
MFYNHEVLTSRKYGVATVWLVATLGSKSNLKRINRKQILDVDVSKACQTIVDPVAPMALRLQGNLLYGVSRVYLQQCGYVLSDAQAANNAMNLLLRTVKDAALDPDAGKARPEQLVLQDDPSFLPEYVLQPADLFAGFNLNLDLLPNSHSGDSQSLTPFESQQSQSSPQVSVIGGLVLPSSSTSQHGDFQFEGDDVPGSINRPSDVFGAGGLLNLDEPDFTFGDDGNIIQLGDDGDVPRTPGVHGGSTMPGDASASARVRREHEEGRQAGAQIPGDDQDMDLPNYGDDLPEGQAFPSADQGQFHEHYEVVESSSSTVAAPMRRKPRAVRVLPTDRTIELRNADLAAWNTNYLQNMRAAAKPKAKLAAAARAKKNAEHYVWGSGLGGIGRNFPDGNVSNPFEMFIGDSLFESITGMSRQKGKTQKHDRDNGIDDATQEESRRVRQKTGDFDNEKPRGDDDESGFQLGDADFDVELPREATTALDDQQIFSAMPWNMSASIRGSSAVPRSGLGSLDRTNRGSRKVSASPLHGRGLGQADRLDALKSIESDGDYGLGGDDFALLGPSSDHPDLEAPVHTTTRVRDAVSAEGANFLTFVMGAIAGKRKDIQAATENMSDALPADAASNVDEITFEELLPPRENSKLVACQGLMMVLGLGNKGMLNIQQSEHLGEINLQVTPQAHASQVIVLSDHEESEAESDGELLRQEHDDSDEDGGHFQGHIAAGHAVPHDDDRDELYDDSMT